MTVTSEGYDKSEGLTSSAQFDAETPFGLLSESARVKAYLSQSDLPSSSASSFQHVATAGPNPKVPMLTRPRVTLGKLPSTLSTQKWEGCVLAVEEDLFRARLKDLTQVGPLEEAEIEIDAAELIDDDKELIKPGAVFYWYIGNVSLDRGQHLNVSSIRFRRLPSWNEEQVKAAQAKAEKIQQLLGWQQP